MWQWLQLLHTPYIFFNAVLLVRMVTNIRRWVLCMYCCCVSVCFRSNGWQLQNYSNRSVLESKSAA